MKWPEFYLEKQGRPESKVAQDMETRQPNVSYSYIKTMVDQMLEDAMKDELAEIAQELEKLVKEIRQVKLHLASMSNAPVTEKDGEE